MSNDGSILHLMKKLVFFAVFTDSQIEYLTKLKMENIRPQMNKNLSINSSEASAKEAADTMLENLIHC
jgi:hypothetical protein